MNRFLAKKLRECVNVLNDHFVRVLVIAALVIISTMLVIQFATYQPERYTGFGLLNDSKEAGPFPANVSYTGSLTTYADVLNRQGNVELYQLEVFIGDSSTTVDPVKGIVGGMLVSRFQQIVLDGQDWEQQVQISFNKNLTLVGTKTLFFALWQCDTNIATYHFTRQELHIHVDVLGP